LGRASEAGEVLMTNRVDGYRYYYYYGSLSARRGESGAGRLRVIV
jgi:hypothetical protein